MTKRNLTAHVRSDILLHLIAVNAYEHYSRTLVGNPAPRTAQMFEVLSKPQVGDLVLEISTVYREPWDSSGLGRLLAIRYEPAGPGGFEDAWDIERLDGQGIQTWRNCRFIKVMENIRREFPAPSKETQ